MPATESPYAPAWAVEILERATRRKEFVDA
jgi:hypothetical protein